MKTRKRPVAVGAMKRRWREDGGDFITGQQTGREGKDGKWVPRGPGGLASWRVNPWGYMASAWTPLERMKQRYFKTPEAAQRHIERWLSKRVGR